ncbi:MAG: PAS domain S-box protein [Synechococcus sp. Tobar2m-G35]|jgi:PAS domain S-box-containing protein|nr:PAS domain S-box protein [Synechococcus sp. Tobar2m-G35]
MALIARDDSRPWLLVDHLGEVLAINDCFTRVYGWRDTDLLGQHMERILPDSFRDSHHAGFARFRLDGISRVLDHPLVLQTICRDGTGIRSEHFITAERRGDDWVFAATLTPLEGAHAAPASGDPQHP